MAHSFFSPRPGPIPAVRGDGESPNSYDKPMPEAEAVARRERMMATNFRPLRVNRAQNHWHQRVDFDVQEEGRGNDCYGRRDGDAG